MTLYDFWNSGGLKLMRWFWKHFKWLAIKENVWKKYGKKVDFEWILKSILHKQILLVKPDDEIHKNAFLDELLIAHGEFAQPLILLYELLIAHFFKLNHILRILAVAIIGLINLNAHRFTSLNKWNIS